MDWVMCTATQGFGKVPNGMINKGLQSWISLLLGELRQNLQNHKSNRKRGSIRLIQFSKDKDNECESA